MDRTQQIETEPNHRLVYWWICPTDCPARVEVVGVNPEGEPLWLYPVAVTLPTEIWVTRWGFTVDGWKFLGWSLWEKGNFDTLGRWVASWSRESDDVRRVLNEFLDELEWRCKNLVKAGTTRRARGFLFKPKPDLDLPLSKNGWIQGDFPF